MYLLYAPASKEYMAEVRQLLYKNQKGRCAICHKHRNLRNLVVDHDHESGYIRGLLCTGCNTGLGFFQDSVLFLEFAKQYLVKHGKREEDPKSSLKITPIEATVAPWIDEDTGKAI